MVASVRRRERVVAAERVGVGGPHQARRDVEPGGARTRCSAAWRPSTATSTRSSPSSATRPRRPPTPPTRPSPTACRSGRCTACRSRSRRTSTSPAGRPLRVCPPSPRPSSPVDAPVVERMRAAGAIPFARTNLPDFGLRVHTDSTLRGLDPQPVAPRRDGRRIERRRGQRAGQRDDTARARQRPRRLAAQPGPLLRHRLDQAVDGRRARTPRSCRRRTR